MVTVKGFFAVGVIVALLAGCGGGGGGDDSSPILDPIRDGDNNGTDDGNDDDGGSGGDDDSGPGDDDGGSGGDDDDGGDDTPVDVTPDWSETHYYQGNNHVLMAVDVPSFEQRIVADDLVDVGQLYTRVEAMSWPIGGLFGATQDNLKLVVIDDQANVRTEFEHDAQTMCESHRVDGDASVKPSIYVQWSGLDLTCDSDDDVVQRVDIEELAAVDTSLKTSRVEAAWAGKFIEHLIGVDRSSGKIVIMDADGANPIPVGDAPASQWHVRSPDGSKVALAINGDLYGSTFTFLKGGGVRKVYGGSSISLSAMDEKRAVFVDGVKLIIWDFGFQTLKPIVDLGSTRINGHQIEEVVAVDTGGNYSYAKVRLADDAGLYWISISIFNRQVYELGEATSWVSGFIKTEDNAFYLNTVDHSGDTAGYTGGRLVAKLMYGSGSTYASFLDSVLVPVVDRRTGSSEVVLLKGKASNGDAGHLSYPTVVNVHERFGTELESLGEIPFTIEAATTDHRLEDGFLIGLDREGGLKEAVSVVPADGVTAGRVGRLHQSPLNELVITR